MSSDESDPLYKSRVSALTQALADLGWTDGRNLRMDLRWGRDDTNGIRALAHELVGLQPDIILANTTPATIALQRETQTIPIVFVDVTDPVGSAIVARLDRPSGNITGFAQYEASLGGKWLELLSEFAPGLKRAAIMFNPDTAPVSTYMPSFETAARSLKVALIVAPVHSDAEIGTAINALGREPGGGLVVISPRSRCNRCKYNSTRAGFEGGDDDDSDCFPNWWRPCQIRPRRKPEPPGEQHHRCHQHDALAGRKAA
jgi:putative ABC transport system substrate-binding protein